MVTLSVRCAALTPCISCSTLGRGRCLPFGRPAKRTQGERALSIGLVFAVASGTLENIGTFPNYQTVVPSSLSTLLGLFAGWNKEASTGPTQTLALYSIAVQTFQGDKGQRWPLSLLLSRHFYIFILFYRGVLPKLRFLHKTQLGETFASAAVKIYEKLLPLKSCTSCSPFYYCADHHNCCA